MPQPQPSGPDQPLPLFRPEALAAQQQKYYGEILLIRPLSLSMFFWLGVGVSVVVFGFLLLGTIVEKTRIAGVLLPAESDGLKAELYVPVRAIGFVHLGQSIRLRCQSCPEEVRMAPGNVTAISQSPISNQGVVAPSKLPGSEPAYRITLTLPATQANLPPQGAAVDAELPLGRKRLLQWLFERGDSTKSDTGSARGGN